MSIFLSACLMGERKMKMPRRFIAGHEKGSRTSIMDNNRNLYPTMAGGRKKK